MRQMLLSTFVLPALLISGATLAATNTSDRPIAKPPAGFKAFAAVVDSNGTLIRGKAGASVTYIGGGNYRVHFPKNISGCVFTGVLGTTGSSGVVSPGYLTVAGDALDADGIYVQTFNSSGTTVDSSFHILASC